MGNTKTRVISSMRPLNSVFPLGSTLETGEEPSSKLGLTNSMKVMVTYQGWVQQITITFVPSPYYTDRNYTIGFESVMGCKGINVVEYAMSMEATLKGRLGGANDVLFAQQGDMTYLVKVR